MVVFCFDSSFLGGSDISFADLLLKEKDVGRLFKALRAAVFKMKSLQSFTLDSIGFGRKCGSG